MKKTHSVIVLLFLAQTAFAQTQMQDRMNLETLLTARAKNFSAYTTSIQQHSGIFGNKTKRDLEKSNEVLIRIVTLDNNIMDELKRTLDYKTFEKTTGSYNSHDCELRLEQSMHVTDTLSKQLNILEKKIKSSDAAAYKYSSLFYLFVAISMILTGVIFFKVRKARQY